MSAERTDYEQFEQSSVQNRRRLREEELILAVTEALCTEMETSGITKTQLAANLGKSKGFVSQLLAGGRNLTLRSIADVADAIGRRAHFSLAPEQVRSVVNPGTQTLKRTEKPVHRPHRPHPVRKSAHYPSASRGS
jgi:hypothetical protein